MVDDFAVTIARSVLLGNFLLLKQFLYPSCRQRQCNS